MFGILDLLNEGENIAVVLTNIICLGEKEVLLFGLGRLYSAIVQVDGLFIVAVL